MPLCGLVGWAVLKCDLEWLCLSLAGGGRCLSPVLERVELEPSWCSGATSQHSYSGAVPDRSLDGRSAPELGSRAALSWLGGAHLSAVRPEVRAAAWWGPQL